jgi:hypothetical protein
MRRSRRRGTLEGGKVREEEEEEEDEGGYIPS